MSILNIPSCVICTVDFVSTAQIEEKVLTFEETKVIQEDDLKLIQTKCNHIFHNSCLMRWIKEFSDKTTTPTCPTCRTVLIDQPAVDHPTPDQLGLSQLAQIALNHGYFLWIINEENNSLNTLSNYRFSLGTPSLPFADSHHTRGFNAPLPGSLFPSHASLLHNLGNAIFNTPPYGDEADALLDPLSELNLVDTPQADSDDEQNRSASTRDLSQIIQAHLRELNDAINTALGPLPPPNIQLLSFGSLSHSGHPVSQPHHSRFIDEGHALLDPTLNVEGTTQTDSDDEQNTNKTDYLGLD